MEDKTFFELLLVLAFIHVDATDASNSTTFYASKTFYKNPNRSATHNRSKTINRVFFAPFFVSDSLLKLNHLGAIDYFIQV